MDEGTAATTPGRTRARKSAAPRAQDDGVPIHGTGRWLIACNNSPAMYCSRNPNSEQDDLVLSGYGAVVISQSWLDVPWFMQDVQHGRISLLRTDSLPVYKSRSALVREWVDGGISTHAALVIWDICSSDPIPPYLDQLIELDSRQVTAQGRHKVSRWDVVRDHLPFLRKLLEVERGWRNRAALVRRLEEQIARLEAQAHV